MMQFEAPHPLIQTTSILPNPQFSDQEALTARVNKHYASDGTLYTYVKTTSGRRKLLWEFRLTQPKAKEFRAFCYSYFASKIRVTDHNGRQWIGNFTNNPFEFVSESRAYPAVGDFSRGETISISIEFEGIEQ